MTGAFFSAGLAAGGFLAFCCSIQSTGWLGAGFSVLGGSGLVAFAGSAFSVLAGSGLVAFNGSAFSVLAGSALTGVALSGLAGLVASTVSAFFTAGVGVARTGFGGT